MNETLHRKRFTPALSVFAGGGVASLLPQDGFGEYGTLCRSIIVGLVTGIAALAIILVQNRLAPVSVQYTDPKHP